jgi:hypothetical protein
MYARGRPQIAQRLCCWTLNFAGRSDLMIFDFFAILIPFRMITEITSDYQD